MSTVWRRRDGEKKKRELWNEHKRLGLDSDLEALVKQFGKSEIAIIAIRERDDV